MDAQQAQFDLNLAVAGLRNQVESDQRLVEVLWSYIRDNVSPRDQVRIETDLLNRGLGDSDTNRARSLRRYAAALDSISRAESDREVVVSP